MGKPRERAFDSPNCEPFFFQGDDHGVLLIHGFTGSCSHMRLIGDELSKQGFTVMGINLPGHAKSIDEMDKTGMKDWINYSDEKYRELREKCKYVSVAGLSMGGDITLLLAEKYALTAAVPISAPMGVQNKLLPLAGVLSPIVHYISWGDDDPEARANRVIPEYDYGYTGFPTHCAGDLWKIIKKTRKNLAKVSCPVMAVQSHADTTVSRDSADVIISGVSSATKKALWLEEVPHVCTATREYAHIAGEMGKFLREAQSAAGEN